jgi:hypothetical protein
MARILVLLAVLFLGPRLGAQSTPIAGGERVRVTTNTSPPRRVVGTMVQLTRDSLIILARPPWNLEPTREAFFIRSVRSVEVKRPTSTRGIVAGAFLGSVAGAVAAAVGLSASADSGEIMFGGAIVAVAGAVGAAVGGTIGYVVDRAGWTEVVP